MLELEELQKILKFYPVVCQLKNKDYTLTYVKSKYLTEPSKTRVKKWRKYVIDYHLENGTACYFHWLFGYTV